MVTQASLPELIAGWGVDGPATLLELWFADASTLTQPQLDLRALAVELVHGADEVPITSADAALELLLPAASKKKQTGRLRALPGSWTTYVLDADRKRVLTRTKDTGWAYSKRVSRLFPGADALPTLPTGGVYLTIWGGSATVLSIADIRERVRALCTNAPVADVLFYDKDAKGGPTLWSVRGGCGDQSGVHIPFPNDTHLKEVTTWH